MKPTRTILFISKGSHSASTRYRALNYFDLFKNHGWNVEHLSDDKSYKARREILSKAGNAEVVVIVRRAISGLYAYLLRRKCKHLIFDFDDAIFLPRSGKHSRRPKRFKSTIKKCDHVWAGNPFLADAAKKHNTNVTIIPTSIDINRYKVITDKTAEETQLVWIGSRSTKKYLLDIMPALELAGQKCKNLTLNIIADFELTAEHVQINNIRWSAETEIKYLSLSHIGIAPMKDTLWSRGKCGLKVLQYMASGLPVITSPVGANKEMITDNENGLYATTDDEWVKAINSLYLQNKKQIEMGKIGYQRCLQKYTMTQTFKTMLDTLESM